MNIISDLQISGRKEIQLPDSYTNLSAYLAPDDDFVISRGLDGSVVSHFRDDTWDVRMYDAKNKCVYNFASWCSEPSNALAQSIQRELKIMQLARLYLSGKPRKVNSIRLMYLRDLARLSFNNRISLTELFNNTTHRAAIISSFAALPPSTMKSMLTVVRELFNIRTKHSDFVIAPSSYELMECMESIYNKFPKAKLNDPQQTKLIPSRIYGELICALSAMLDAFNDHSAGICALYNQRIANPLYAVTEAQHRSKHDSTLWTDAISQHGLTPYLENLSITNWPLLNRYIAEIQIAAKYWIHLFSGMRDNEANFLPADAYTSIDIGEVTFKILRGYTSKISAQNHTATFWVTHSIVEKGINAARAVGRVSALKCGWDDVNKSQFPLFPGKISRQKRSGSANRNTWHFEGAPAAGSITESTQRKLLARIPALSIREEDICELEKFDGFRDWRAEPTIKLGKPWPLATHQCRRSLAVYGARSGLISLGASALQFKQLTEAMASYYRKGSAFAVNFLQTDDAQNWMDELEHERRTAQFIQYEIDVINTTNRLWGGEGNRIQVARDKGQPLIITTDRLFTERKFFKGEMTYKTGPIGGCSNLEHCDKISFTSIFACIDCDKSILDDDRSLRNIKRGVNNLKREQALFVPENPQYKQLESEIDALYEKLEKRGLREKMEVME
ncbi:hypothetical protein SAMN05660489_05571 [Pseudomonas sp. LAMO17WK12:I10]|uniref:hypothetical protein n=1 Tax=unclassified Pseudomonas TaxID=196821 RepID=UPI000BCC67D9|nr:MULTISPECIES: hypothetical protein [unclassified Pseudomonas]PXX55658.1 hypothetical protein H160_05495 [Pseudomonas sp. LAMO17WK12:I9]SNY50864.1 hypothetical protein SAMN05660489_05571 [Pseudomonas sp. LAMO17WK12:I10]